MIVTFWDGSGNTKDFDEPDGLFQATWVPVDEASAAQKLLFKSLADLLSSAVRASKTCLCALNSVMQVELDDGRIVIVRQCYLDAQEQSRSPRRFQNEAGLIRWLAPNTRIPVPSILAMSEPTADIPAPFMVMNKLPGGTIFQMLSRMDFTAKKNLISSYVDFGLELFRLDVPQLIGSTTVDCSGNLEVIPLVTVSSEFSTDRIFHSLEEFVKFTFTRKREAVLSNATEAEIARGLSILDELETLVISNMENLAHPGLRRCILTHEDLSDKNVLADINGTITGVIDWEFHSILPALLGADYPPWLSYSGPGDPRYVLDNGLENWWLVSREESQKLISYYDEVAMKEDPVYYEALKKGEFLRTAIAWLHCDCEPGFELIRTWMAEVNGHRDEELPVNC